jgi:hypothetical protein
MMLCWSGDGLAEIRDVTVYWGHALMFWQAD